MAREAIDVCLLMLKESTNGRFDSYRVKNSVLIISQITVRDCREHIFLLTFLEIAVLTRWLAQLGRLCQGGKIRACVNAVGSGKGVNFILIQTLSEVDWTGTVTLSRDNFSSHTVKGGLSIPQIQ